MRSVLWILLCVCGLAVRGEAYNVYYGNMHSHSALSDGIGTPTEAYSHANLVAGIDVLALTDHTHLLTDPEWNQLLAAADAMNDDGAFVAIGGQEFGNLNDFGHMNIFDCLYPCRVPTENLLAAYDFVQNQGAFATFNHPNPDYGTQFNGLAFVPEYGDEMVGIEIRNGIRADDYEAQYIEALQKGWKVAPLANQDNHEGNWGDQTNPNMGGQIYLTGFLADELTREAIYDAFRQRRFYAMEVDPPSDRIELFFYANGEIMGRQVVSGAHLTLTGSAHAVNGAGLFNRVDLFQDGVVVASSQPLGPSIEWRFDRALMDGESHFYFVRVRQVDGDCAWSAPVWVVAAVDPAGAGEAPADLPEASLLSVAPNPFRGTTTFSFLVPYRPDGMSRRVGLRLLDLAGGEVGRMPERVLGAGSYEWTWEAWGRERRSLPAGVYFCQLLVDDRVVSLRRVVLAR